MFAFDTWICKVGFVVTMPLIGLHYVVQRVKLGVTMGGLTNPQSHDYDKLI